VTNAQTSTSSALSREEYAMHCRAARRKSVEGFIEEGGWLNEAKRNLPHGEYGNLVKEDLGYSEGRARKLRKIATAFGGNRSIWNALPPCWTTLYQLALIPMPRLEALIEEGIVHAGMDYEKAQQLAKDENGQRHRSSNRDADDHDDADADDHAGDHAGDHADDHAGDHNDHDADAYELPDLIEGIFNGGGNGSLTLQRRIEALADRNTDSELRRDVIGSLRGVNTKTVEFINLLESVAGESDVEEVA
jgi:hypothetical protein